MSSTVVDKEKPIERLKLKVHRHLTEIYPTVSQDLAEKLIGLMDYQEPVQAPIAQQNHWSEKDVILITYGNTVKVDGEAPLRSLENFLDRHFSEVINSVHVLPFFPYTSDDGFAVMNYRRVNEALGGWDDIQRIAAKYNLMSDLVINHCSSHSDWFEQFKRNLAPGRDYFVTADPAADLSAVVRPRTNELLQAVQTPVGTRHVWCTFSHDQVDLNFANPDLLLEMIAIVVFYLSQGVKILRLDAIAFIWKVPGTSCLNLKQAHEIVRLLRTLIEYKDPTVLIITETNIPNRENLAYFGNANEAHIIYNFALPPLLLHAIATGNNFYLNNWLMSMPPAADGTTYLNFIASHDGIGLRPVEGILADDEVRQLLDLMQSFGGRISWRNYGSEKTKAYEINISLFAALRGTLDGRDDHTINRVICVHAIMAALEGIPAFYIHSLLATPNDETNARALGNNRAINRHVWDSVELDRLIEDPDSDTAKVLCGLTEMLSIRKHQPAFHPNATQYTLHLGSGLFAFWRQSRSRHQSIFCIHNITNQIKTFSLTDLNLIETHQWKDLLSDTAYLEFDAKVSLSPYQCMWLTNFWPK